MKKPSSNSVNALKTAKDVGKLTFSREALDDLDLIWAFIAQDNPRAADRVQEAAFRVCKTLADHPELGRLRMISKRGFKDVRSFVITEHPSYLIFYRIVAEGVQIVRVVHGARDIEKLLGGS